MDENLNLTGNTDIEKALKEFEQKSASETGSYKAVKLYDETTTPKMVQLVMKYSGGSIKSQRTAEYVLLGLVIIMFVFSFYLFFGSNQGSNVPLPAGANVVYPPGEPPRLEYPLP